MTFQGDLKVCLFLPLHCARFLINALQYWASCLAQYRGQFRYPAVQRYLHDLSSELADHIDSITSSLSLFIEVGTLLPLSLSLVIGIEILNVTQVFQQFGLRKSMARPIC